MNMNYKYLCTMVFLCLFTMTSLVAQKDNVTSAMLLITYKKASDTNQRDQINLTGEEAYQFDVADFLSKNKYEDIQVNGGGVINNERLTWHFRSKDVKSPANGKYSQILTSIDKSPFLGVGVVAMDDFSGARITQVIEGSSAETYGFQIGDVITLINDYEIYTPCDLTKAIRQSQPGDLLEVDIVRGDENQTLEPTLGYRLHKRLSWRPAAIEQPVVLENTESKNLWNADLSIFPNPTDGIAQVEYTSSKVGDVEMNLTDLTGRIIFTQKIEKFDGFYNDAIDLTAQPDGVYFLNIIQGEEVKTEKIVLQKK